jgi:hypothetical protein
MQSGRPKKQTGTIGLNGTYTLLVYSDDVNVAYWVRLEALTAARQQKVNKYAALARTLKARYHEVKVDAIVLGSLGTWDPENDRLMKSMCSRKYLKIFKKLCISDVIIYSRDIYAENITGVRQQ